MSVKRIALAMTLALLGCTQPRPVRVTERVASPVVQARGAAPLRAAMLAGHADARAEVGLPPLIWDDALAVDAAAWAQTMARTRQFRHAEQPQGPKRQGENLFTGTRGAYGYREMVDLWVAEKKDFINRPTPNFSRTGRWGDVGHYTQIVWRSTNAVGCALASGGGEDYLVCRYRPAGNVVGVAAF